MEKKVKREPLHTSPQGFININNNCFVLCILQCLYALDTFPTIINKTVNSVDGSSLEDKIFSMQVLEAENEGFLNVKESTKFLKELQKKINEN